MLFILVYLAIVFLVIEIAVVLMRSTGLEHDIARFQVVSLMTSTGFTTKESELILGHPVRRKIGIFLILFGVFSFAVIISAVSAILVKDFRILTLAETASGLGVFLLVLRLPAVRRKLTDRLHKPLEDKFEVHELPIIEVMLHSDDDLFVDLPVGENSGLIGRTMEKLACAEEDVNLLFIQRGTVNIRENRMATVIEAGDMLYLYGGKKDIRRLFGAELEEREKLKQEQIESKILI